DPVGRVAGKRTACIGDPSLSFLARATIFNCHGATRCDRFRLNNLSNKQFQLTACLKVCASRVASLFGPPITPVGRDGRSVYPGALRAAAEFLGVRQP